MSDTSLPEDEGLEAGLAAGFGAPVSRSLTALEPRAGPAVPRVALRPGAVGPTAPATRPSSAGPEVQPIGRTGYRLEGEIARGGMGVLLKCRDVDLGRDVALKVLREDLAARPEFVQRFVEEAQIGGQLQHPGIVPVYELGLLADQRPYFAMELVHGRTLAALLAERDGQERRLLLDAFAAVCQTMAYTHARGVVHRDLKPENVLIGSFGEVQLIDWGLAKVLPAVGAGGGAAATGAPAAEVPSIATVRSGSASGGTPSIAGSVMGTPAYMSPEQARGEVERIDERSDVFALGAILCEILTGDPPYRGGAQRTVAQARAAAVQDAYERLDACDVDSELIELCRQCLAPDLEDRPRSGGVVSERMQAYLASLEVRARQAEVHTAEVRVRARWTVLLTSLAAALAVVAVVLLWARREALAARVSETERAVGAALTEVTLARGRADWSAAEAALALAQARSESPHAGDELRARVATTRADFERELQIERAREELARDDAAWLAELESVRQPEGDSVYPTDQAALDRGYAATFAARGVDVDAAELEPTVRALAARGIALELATALDEWTRARRGALDPAGAERLRRLADALDPDPLRASLRAAQAAQDPEALLRIAQHARSEPLPPQTLRLLAHEFRRAGAELELGIELLRAGCLQHPSDYGLALELGRALRSARPPRGSEALEAHRVALALRPTSVTAWHELGMTLYPILGRPEEAVALFRAAILRFPDDSHLDFHLGTALGTLGRNEEAAVSLRRATEGEPHFALAWSNLAAALSVLGRREEALEGYERALELDPKLVEANHNLGVVLREGGEWDEAQARFERVLELAPDYVRAHTELAYLHILRGDPEAAIEHARRAIELDPGSSYDHYTLGRTLAATGRAAEARAALEACVRIAPDFAAARRELALLLLASESDDVRDARAGLEHARRLVELSPADAEAHAILGIALYASGDLEAAWIELERAGPADPGDPGQALFVGLCALGLERPDEARALLASIDLDRLADSKPGLVRFIDEARAFLSGR